jgi:hypothetical protein
MLTLILSAALAAAPETAAPGGAPPQQAVAIIDGEGNLRITIATCNCFGPGVQEIPIDPTDKSAADKAPIKVKTTSVTLTTVELPAKVVEGYTADGQAVKREKLAELLAKERAVLVSMDGKKVDPFLLQLYKEGTIVLVPPANTVGTFGGFAGVQAAPFDGPLTLPPGPIEKPKPIPDEKKP